MKNWRKQILIVVLGLSVVVAVAGYSHSAKRADPVRVNDSMPPVVVTATEAPVVIRATGYVTPFASVALKSRVDGQLETALFKEGGEVKPGEPVLVIESSSARAALRLAEVTLHRDEALVGTAVAEAHRDDLFSKQGVVPAAQAEQTRAAAEAARAAVVADQVAVENAQLEVSLCHIASPIGGRIGKLLVPVGTVVKKHETVMAIINQTRSVYVEFGVPAEDWLALRNELANGPLLVHVGVPGKPGKSCEGTVDFFDNTAQANTGMILFRARFVNEDEELWPGEKVGVTLTLEKPASPVDKLTQALRQNVPSVTAN